jgi:hypothetical protein
MLLERQRKGRRFAPSSSGRAEALPFHRGEDDEVGIGEAGGVALPIGEGGDVVCFAGHFFGEYEVVVPGSGPHRFEFTGPTPPVFAALMALLFANTAIGLLGEFVARHFFESLRMPAGFIHWYLDAGFIYAEFIILALLAVTLLIYRKQVRYTYRGQSKSK